MIGQAPEFKSVLRAMKMVAATDATVLITGESGTGKELLAQAVHRESQRRDKAFITVNCAALPEHLAENELFGHVKGAFTGAVHNSLGKIQAAQGGTLLLDEVGELPLTIQAKLLRFIETGECQPVGRPTTVRMDVRVIAATNRDLAAQVEQGRFRKDLYYRLNVVPLELPPLKARQGDIELLLKHLTEQLASEHGLPTPSYAADTLKVLKGYSWPGNVRELKNLCERMVIWFPGKQVAVGNLPSEIRARVAPMPVASNLFSLPDRGVKLDELEEHLIRQALSRTMGNRSKAARLLGLSRDTLLYRIKKYEIDYASPLACA